MSENKSSKSIKETKKPLESISSLLRNADNPHQFISLIKEELKDKLKSTGLANDFNVFFLFDKEGSISDFESNYIYKSLKNLDVANPKDNLLILHSRGGSAEPAYLISKAFRNSGTKFIVVVPRKAKSAATLIALGADEIHMGVMSQLGPIDPQIQGLPALGIQSSVDYLVDICEKHPSATDMLSKYLSNQLDIRILGYFQRVPESAVQYAENLLISKGYTKESASKIAYDLVYLYKDHSFAIDSDEARKLLTKEIKVESDEYLKVSEIYELLEDIDIALRIKHKKTLFMVGSLENGSMFFSELD